MKQEKFHCDSRGSVIEYVAILEHLHAKEEIIQQSYLENEQRLE